MGKTAYPVEGDGYIFLASAGLVPVASAKTEAQKALQLDDAMKAGRLAFEEIAGRTMLAVSSTRTLDPPKNYGAILRFGADMGGTPTLVQVDGSTKVLNTDFYLFPENADADGKPWQWMEFANPYIAGLQKRRSVAITAPWGYGSTIPEDAWLAMIKLGIVKVGAAIGTSLSNGLLAFKSSTVEEQYGKDPLAGFLDRCEAEARATAGNYVKATSYL